MRSGGSPGQVTRHGIQHIWPIIIAVIAMYALALKVFALNLNPSNPTRVSTELFFVTLIAAVLLALIAPPWYD